MRLLITGLASMFIMHLFVRYGSCDAASATIVGLLFWICANTCRIVLLLERKSRDSR